MVVQKRGYTETHTKRAAVTAIGRPGIARAVRKTVILVRVFEKVKAKVVIVKNFSHKTSSERNVT